MGQPPDRVTLRQGTAYATFDGHRNDDFAPHVYKTTDFGATWRPIRSNLPAFGPVRVIRKDYKTATCCLPAPSSPHSVSIDGGRSWQRLMNGLPTVAIADVVVHPRDGNLVASTHGRAFTFSTSARCSNSPTRSLRRPRTSSR